MRIPISVAVALLCIAPGCTVDKARVTQTESGSSIGRLFVKTASLSIKVSSLETARSNTETEIQAAKGYVERTHASEDRISLTCRVPASALEATIQSLSGLGELTSQSVSVDDITEQHTDLSTRLRNSEALRERLVNLLKSAKGVEELLAVEKELSRVQTEIETMQGKLQRLDSQVEMASLSVSLQRERILGPLGYVAYGLWWAVSKLFVID